mgnify:CR=1 FL=1
MLDPRTGKQLQGRELARYRVRERDKFTCQDCGLKRTNEFVIESNKKFGSGVSKGKIKSLDVHHINGMCGKKSKGYDSVKDLTGMITLCHKCHFNRPEHKVQSEDWERNSQTSKNEMLALKFRGKTICEIASLYSISHQRVSQILISLGKEYPKNIPKRVEVDVICFHCRSVFKSSPSKKARYCSRTCFFFSRRKHITGSIIEHRKKRDLLRAKRWYEAHKNDPIFKKATKLRNAGSKGISIRDKELV